jgi:hypothetical protein
MADAKNKAGRAARASLWIAGGTPAVLALVFGIFLPFNLLGFDASRPLGDIIGPLIMAAPIAHLTGAVFGVIAMAKGDRAKLGALGLGLNLGAIAVGALLLYWLLVIAAGAAHMGG